MQLSKRLAAIGKMVTEGNRLVDVGCDHGYLPVYLVLNKRIPGAIAMDVREGPLSRAREHIRQYGLEEYIETRLSDGLEKLMPGEGDTLVIAGMGGPLMERILSEGKAVLSGFSEVIAQPQSDIPHFRRFILAAGFEIVREDMVLEDGKFYPMMKAVPVKEKGEEPYTPEEVAFGRLLLRSRDPILKKYLERELRIRNSILDKLGSAPKGTAQERVRELEEERQLIGAALAYYEG